MTERYWPRNRKDPARAIIGELSQDPERGPSTVKDTFYESYDSREKLLKAFSV